jgi:hypothetical protein
MAFGRIDLTRTGGGQGIGQACTTYALMSDRLSQRHVSGPPARLGYNASILFWAYLMSDHNDAHTSDDPVENVVKHIPLVIPAAGAVLIFLLAFIAVFMA